MRATANHVDHDNNNEQYRDHNTDYGCARYQRTLMMNHGSVYTLKDKNYISDEYYVKNTYCSFAIR